MPRRTLNSDKYAYGFNGQEMSNEIKGVGNSYTAEFWEYDPRVGRRWNLYPKPITGLSEYSAFVGNPIFNSDPLGDTTSPGYRIPLAERLPSGGSVSAGVGNFLYNTVSAGTNAVASSLNSTADYLSAMYSDGIPGVINKFNGSFRSATRTVGKEYDYIKQTPNAQIGADAKAYFTNVDNYFQAAELATLIGVTWQMGAGGNQTALRTSTASDFSLARSTKSGLDGALDIANNSATNVLAKGDLLRIENAATRINKAITVIGSRTRGTAGPFSDWDYIIEGLTNKEWKKIKNSLPGSRSVLDNTPYNIELHKPPVRIQEPHFRVNPR